MTFDDLQVSDLAWIRAIAGLTQAQAAERLGISKSHYAGIEAGSYTGDKVILNVGKLLNEDQINRRSRFCSLYGLSKIFEHTHIFLLKNTCILGKKLYNYN